MIIAKTSHEFTTIANKLIKECQSNDFILFFDAQWEHFKSTELTKVYQNACESGNIIIVDYFLNSPLKLNFNMNFPYAEGSMYEEEIPNGAIFLAGENHSIDLLEYFIKNDIYYIDSKTTEGLEKYMSSVIAIIDKIEFKLHIEERLQNQQKIDAKNTKIKI